MRLPKRILLFLPVLFMVLTCAKEEDPELFLLSVTITPEEGGSVSPDGGTFEDGTSLTLTATPSEGYVFREWRGDLQSTQNPVSASMDNDMNITLVFTKADTDEDGVADDVDGCLNTPKGEEVDENGCSSSQIDTDGDGVSDAIDLCIDTLSGEEVDENGCSDSQKDTDGDGITDDLDVCPGTPEGEDVNEQGCSITPPVYLDENGVTVKAYEWGLPGQTGSIDGVVYTIVDENMLRDMVNNNADVTRVCTSKVTDMSRMFFLDPTFNQDIGSWDVSNVTDMSRMFVGDIMSGFRHPFNQDIGLWDVGNVMDMSFMFSYSSFDKPIGNWDVSSVITMNNMFVFSNFNQPIDEWDVNQVTDMSRMFLFSTSFNQDLSGWNVDNVITCEEFSLNTPQWTLPKPNFTNCNSD